MTNLTTTTVYLPNEKYPTDFLEDGTPLVKYVDIITFTPELFKSLARLIFTSGADAWTENETFDMYWKRTFEK